LQSIGLWTGLGAGALALLALLLHAFRNKHHVSSKAPPETLSYGEACIYVVGHLSNQYKGWSALNALTKSGEIQTWGKERLYVSNEPPTPASFGPTWRPITRQEWASLTPPSMAASLSPTPYAPEFHGADDDKGTKFGFLRVSKEDLERAWPPIFTTDKLRAVTSTRVPLVEAATRSLEQTEHTVIPSFDKMFDHSPDGRLKWHCNFLWERAPIYGVQHPSRKIKEFRWAKCRHTFNMKVEGGIPFLQHQYEKQTRVESLEIEEEDLKRGIKALLDAVEGHS
jgi:hypothetical protein